MATDRQSQALDALSAGAFLAQSDMIAGLATEEHGDDLIIIRQVIGAQPSREQRWRIAPDGSPRLVKDGARLH